MPDSIESLSRELNRFKETFPSLSERLDESVKQFRTAGVAVPEALLSEAAEFKRGVADLGERVLDLGKKLSISKDRLVDSRGATLATLERSLHIIAKVEEQRAIQTNALRILERIGCIMRRDQALFPPLLQCQAEARELHNAIIKFPGTELHPAAKELAAGAHSASMLLRLVENQDDLSDDEWLRIPKVVAESFGTDLAVAAARRKLEVRPGQEKSSDSPAKEPFQKPSSRAEAPPLQITPAQASCATSKPSPLPKGDLDREIEEFVASHGWSGGKATTPLPNAHGAPAARTLESLPSSTDVSLSGFEKEPKIRSKSLPDEQSSVQSVLSEVEAATLEIIRLEVLAERHSEEGNYPEAEAVYQQLLTIQKNIFRPQHPNIAATEQKLAAIQRLQAERAHPEVISKEPTEARKKELATGHSQPMAPVANPASRGSGRETSGNARPVRVGILAVMLLAMGVSIYAAIRYRAVQAGTRLLQSMSVSKIESLQPMGAPPEAVNTPKPVQESHEIAQPNAVPKENTSVQAASLEVRNTAKPVPQPQVLATTRQAVRPEPRETPKPVQQPTELAQPNLTPRATVRKEAELPPPPSPLVRVPPGIGVAGSALSSLINPAVSPPPPAAPSPERIRVGGLTTAAKLIKEIKPTYPPLALQARISGTVRLEGIIGPDGTVQDLKVISGHPLLREEAIKAAKQWRYQPGSLNGVPIAVTTTMDVNFALGN